MIFVNEPSSFIRENWGSEARAGEFRLCKYGNVPSIVKYLDYRAWLKDWKIPVHICAAKAIFYCPSMNSHRPRSQNTAKEWALIPEKETTRKRPRSHVSLEKSSKNYKPLEKWAKPNLLPDVTPQPANFSGDYFRRVCHVVESKPPEFIAVFSCQIIWPN